jgi:uncharacterized protein YigE (DUF2233 family)
MTIEQFLPAPTRRNLNSFEAGGIAALGKRYVIIFLAAFVLFSRASSAEFTNAVIAGKRVTVCRVNVRKEALRLFLYDDAGKPFNSFAAIDGSLQRDGKKLVFGMNAGMFHRGFAPVGLFVSDAREIGRLNTTDGSGNFYLKPNGLFLVSERGARVIETSEHAAVGERILLATQSGPLLVRAGKIHPAFKPDSQSRVIRNGVGVGSADVAVFAITDEAVNLYEFATLFRDVLQCPDALYLDGVISSLHSTKLQRTDKKADLGPIIGVVE